MAQTIERWPANTAALQRGLRLGRLPTLSGCETLAKRFSQMGGNSGPTFLRMVGKDTFILIPAVTAALQRWGAVQAAPKNRKDRKAIQACFNSWSAETSQPLYQLSPILAASTEG